jgi:hypothetical protein
MVKVEIFTAKIICLRVLQLSIHAYTRSYHLPVLTNLYGVCYVV